MRNIHAYYKIKPVNETTVLGIGCPEIGLIGMC